MKSFYVIFGYFLLILNGLIPSFYFGSLKLIPQIIAILFLSFHIVYHFLKWDKLSNNYFIGMFSLLTIVNSMAVAVNVTLSLYPPYTSDGHPLMPISQLFLGYGLGFVLGLIFSFLYFKKARRRIKEEIILSLVLFILFTITTLEKYLY